MNGHDRVTLDETPTDEKQLKHKMGTGSRKGLGTLHGQMRATFSPPSQAFDSAAQYFGQRRRLALIVLAGSLLAAALVVFGLEHTPDYSLRFFGSSGIGTLRLKAKIATGLLGLALFQLFLALWMFGRLPGIGIGARSVGHIHRAVGIVLFLMTLPVAAHCILAYGVEMHSARETMHSLAGCFFYGAFVAKILVIRSRALPAWALPIAGGLLVAALGLLWYSSALWFFNGYHLPIR